MTLLTLFISFVQIGLFSFGGGYAALPLIQEQVVTQHDWLSMAELTDLITISQMTPGPIAINSATFVGMKIAGLPGALCATLGCILPSCIIVTAIAKLYLKYRNVAMLQGVLHSLRPAVVALIASAGISVLVSAFWGGQPRLHRLAAGADFRPLPHPAPEEPGKPRLGDGRSGGAELDTENFIRRDAGDRGLR